MKRLRDTKRMLCVVPQKWTLTHVKKFCPPNQIHMHRGHMHLEEAEVRELLKHSFLRWLQFEKRGTRNKKPCCGVLRLVRMCPSYGISSKVGSTIALNREMVGAVMREQILSRRRQ